MRTLGSTRAQRGRCGVAAPAGQARAAGAVNPTPSATIKEARLVRVFLMAVSNQAAKVEINGILTSACSPIAQKNRPQWCGDADIDTAGHR